MITKIELKNFKRFRNINIDFHPNTISFIVGGNNSGKSTILHALAVWEFCKTILVFEKGNNSILEGYNGAGLGIAFDNFSPLNIPSFKYIWTNLRANGGYNLSIKCFWQNNQNEEKFLSISLSLVQERLYIKAGDTNIVQGDKIPRIAYLPTFAGISIKEQWYSKAMRQTLIGQGLAGAVLRNEIIDLHRANMDLRAEKKGNAKKIPKAALKYIRENDPYELLQAIVLKNFSGLLYPLPFNPSFHTHVNVEFRKGETINNRFRPYENYTRRDIMVEGSGFLQWLSVYTFALSPDVDVLLLDEPDAHLHVELQSKLIDALKIIATKFNKQILLATHSVEVIKNTYASDILFIKSASIVKYLSEERSKTVVLSELGSEYSPIFEKIQRNRRILFVENDSDVKILKLITEGMIQWPDNLVVWANANHHKERTHVFEYLKRELNNNFKCISLSDKDSQDYSITSQDLKQSNYKDVRDQNNNIEMKYRLWRRSEIENYLIHPNVIARTIVRKNGGDVAQKEQEVRDYLQNNHGIVVNAAFMRSDRTDATRPLFELSGKEIIEGICTQFSIDKFSIAREMNHDEVFEDVITLCNELIETCQ